MTKKDERILNDARAMLDRQSEELDDVVLARLRAARMRATEVADHRSDTGSWFGSAVGAGSSLALTKMMGGLVAASLVFAVAVTVWIANPVVPRNNLEDLEILAASESPEFYQDLDFYLWLETRATRAG
ncbi:MAG: DUF3619 family protein [Acidiferrobacterales bacterium]|jgi:hypothetical protein|nr:DUF3619 family protein [Acidiferrobacterales bacterium]